MSFKHRFRLIVGIAILLVTAEAVMPPSTTGHQLPDADIRNASNVNRALKGDKLMGRQPAGCRAGYRTSVSARRAQGHQDWMRANV
jgi:hypothetical protein